jgi:hypothetical protein
VIRNRSIEDVLGLWGLQIRKIREDIPIAGSPDRCLFRTVIEDGEGKLYILENLAPEFIPHKKKIALVLARRFAWLSDWLKRPDPEMIDLEAVYIQLLLDNREIFTRSWGL